MKPPNQSYQDTPYPTNSKQSTGKGIECYYFSNRDGTGWKIYQDKDNAKTAWANQVWAVRKGLAPLILSGIKRISIDLDLPYSFKCPVSVVFIPRRIGVYGIMQSKKIVLKFCKVNCDMIYKKSVENKAYGFLTEEVECVGTEFLEYGSHSFDYAETIYEKLNFRCGIDFHGGNWGVLNNEIVYIDFGTHFGKRMPVKCKQEIEKIKEQCCLL